MSKKNERHEFVPKRFEFFNVGRGSELDSLPSSLAPRSQFTVRKAFQKIA